MSESSPVSENNTMLDSLSSQIESLLKDAVELKLQGNQLLNDTPQEAIGKYSEGLQVLLTVAEHLRANRSTLDPETVSSVTTELEKIRVDLVMNIGLAEMKSSKYQEALAYLEAVLSVSPRNPKALFRRALCKVNMGGTTQEVVRDLQFLLKSDPGNEDVKQLLKRAKATAPAFALKFTDSGIFAEKTKNAKSWSDLSSWSSLSSLSSYWNLSAISSGGLNNVPVIGPIANAISSCGGARRD